MFFVGCAADDLSAASFLRNFCHAANDIVKVTLLNMANTEPAVRRRAQSGDENISTSRPEDSRENALVVRSQAQNSSFWSRFRYPLLAAGFAFLLSPLTVLWSAERHVDPTNYAERTRMVLKSTPYDCFVCYSILHLLTAIQSD